MTTLELGEQKDKKGKRGYSVSGTLLEVKKKNRYLRAYI